MSNDAMHVDTYDDAIQSTIIAGCSTSSLADAESDAAADERLRATLNSKSVFWAKFGRYQPWPARVRSTSLFIFFIYL